MTGKLDGKVAIITGASSGIGEATAIRRKLITPLQSEDIAAAIVYAVTQPQHVNVNEILIRPTQQER